MVCPNEVISNKKHVLRFLRLNGYYEIYKRNTYPAFVKAIEELKKEGLLVNGEGPQSNFYFATKLVTSTIQVRDIEIHKIQVGDFVGLKCERMENVTVNYFEVDSSIYKSLGAVTSIDFLPPRRNLFQIFTRKKLDFKLYVTTHKDVKDIITPVDENVDFYKEKV